MIILKKLQIKFVAFFVFTIKDLVFKQKIKKYILLMSYNSWPIFSYLSKYLNKYYLNYKGFRA